MRGFEGEKSTVSGRGGATDITESEGFFFDLFQSIGNKSDVYDATTKLLVDTLREQLSSHSSVLLVAHSQGAAISDTASSINEGRARARRRDQFRWCRVSST